MGTSWSKEATRTDNIVLSNPDVDVDGVEDGKKRETP